MGNQGFDEVLESMVALDPRYHRDAYLFVREGLDYTQQQICKQETGSPRHVGGQELLGGLRAYGREQFGPMTLMVLTEWGIYCCEDFGEIVFNMVESRLLAKTDDDCREDFRGGYDFLDAFRKPFLPLKTPGQTKPSRLGILPANSKSVRTKPQKPKSSDIN